MKEELPSITTFVIDMIPRAEACIMIDQIV